MVNTIAMSNHERIYHTYEASPTIMDVVVEAYSNHSKIELFIGVKKYLKYGIFTTEIKNASEYNNENHTEDIRIKGRIDKLQITAIESNNKGSVKM